MQPVEKLIYDENSSVRFNYIKRLETEIKWIKLLQSASPLGFNDNIYQEGNISKMPDFYMFSRSYAFWILRLIGFIIGITKCMRLHF